MVGENERGDIRKKRKFSKVSSEDPYSSMGQKKTIKIKVC